MKVVYDKTVMQNPLAVLRKAGYSPTVDPVTKQESYMLRTSGELYPRFHLYVEDRGSEVTFSLHFDQKKPSYGTDHAHNGEYEGPMITKEMRRIDSWVTNVRNEGNGELGIGDSGGEGTLSPKKPWWQVW
jgi:hypothetical protein